MIMKRLVDDMMVSRLHAYPSWESDLLLPFFYKIPKSGNRDFSCAISTYLSANGILFVPASVSVAT